MNVLIKSSVVHKPLYNSNTILLKGDSGATNHYITKTAITLMDNVKPNKFYKCNSPK